jgi:hypothetical protein
MKIDRTTDSELDHRAAEPQGYNPVQLTIVAGPSKSLLAFRGVLDASVLALDSALVPGRELRETCSRMQVPRGF